MLVHTLSLLFERDLNTLKQELSLYEDESKLWLIQGEISNSAGHLALHLIGNLNHFIGAVLGNSGYVRQRDLEFSSKNIPVAELYIAIDDTITVIHKTLQGLTEDDLKKDYTLKVFKDVGVMSTAYFLMHLTMHLSYHLGQVNYHRRLLKY